MPEQFNVVEYVGYLLQRWRFFAAASAAAIVLSLGITLLFPKQYTATASILIDAPAGNDPRASTAVSPIYLESLRTYEHFAESDTVFLEALRKFNLRAEYPSAAADSLRRRVLKVTKPRDTKILQISATLRDAGKAQALAQYIAERTVSLNQTLSRQSDQDLINEGQRQLDVARAKLHQAEDALQQESIRAPYEALQAEVDNLVELRARLRKELLEARVDSADYAVQGNQHELSSVRARAETLEKQVSDIDRELGPKEKLASQRHARWEDLNAELKGVRTTAQTAEARLNDILSSVGIRSERLRIIDPGIVPQRPSSPSLPLNVAVALFLALIFCWVYLTAAFSFRGQGRHVAARAYSAER